MKIQVWENHEKRKAEMEMKKMEVFTVHIFLFPHIRLNAQLFLIVIIIAPELFDPSPKVLLINTICRVLEISFCY